MTIAPDDADVPEEGTFKRSALAEELQAFKQSIFETVEKRDRLPQPMFWAVFGSRLEEVKKAKALKRALDEKLGGL